MVRSHVQQVRRIPRRGSGGGVEPRGVVGPRRHDECSNTCMQRLCSQERTPRGGVAATAGTKVSGRTLGCDRCDAWCSARRSSPLARGQE